MVGQPITDPISGSSLDFSKTCPEVNQDVRVDPELDNIWFSRFINNFISRFKNSFVLVKRAKGLNLKGKNGEMRGR